VFRREAEISLNASPRGQNGRVGASLVGATYRLRAPWVQDAHGTGATA